MTELCVDEAFNYGVQAVLDIAAAVAQRMRADRWRPGKEGAADALDELAVAGRMLLRDSGKAADGRDAAGGG